MKSRRTTYLLLIAAVGIWGLVTWKIFFPADRPVPAAQVQAFTPPPRSPVSDTLRTDYPDPFLKGFALAERPVVRTVRMLPGKPAVARREQLKIIHLGTISSAGQRFYILTVGDRQYELPAGGRAGDFELTGCSRDSLYLQKDGVIYGVKLCD